MLIKEMLFGYYDTQCIYIIAELNIANYLQDGSQDISYLAKKTNVDENKLYRIMRFLSSKGLFDQSVGMVFSLNKESKQLISTGDSSLNDFVRFHGKYFYQSARKILEGIKTNNIPFNIEFEESFWGFLNHNCDAGKIFNNSMKCASDSQAKIITDIYDFSTYKTVVDLGGGLGSLLVNILHKYKSVTGINLDLPTLSENATNYFISQGLGDRCKYISGSFLEDIPKGCDLYILKAILHGKNDDLSMQVLKKCKSAMPNHGRLLVIDRVISDDNDYVEACANDINMLNVSGGKDRTLEEFKVLFDISGLTIASVKKIQQSLSIIELE